MPETWQDCFSSDNKCAGVSHGGVGVRELIVVEQLRSRGGFQETDCRPHCCCGVITLVPCPAPSAVLSVGWGMGGWGDGVTLASHIPYRIYRTTPVTIAVLYFCVRVCVLACMLLCAVKPSSQSQRVCEREQQGHYSGDRDTVVLSAPRYQGSSSHCSGLPQTSSEATSRMSRQQQHRTPIKLIDNLVEVKSKVSVIIFLAIKETGAWFLSV